MHFALLSTVIDYVDTRTMHALRGTCRWARGLASGHCIRSPSEFLLARRIFKWWRRARIVPRKRILWQRRRLHGPEDPILCFG